MNNKLQDELEKQKQGAEPYVSPIPGILGIPMNGQKRVEVLGRNSYVYVRLRSNQSEVIQAYNNQVATAYNLPVLVKRQGNKYVVIGVDSEKYENNWSSQAAFIPRHGNSHSFDIESGGGGDVVWVYPRQFTPTLVMPSGSSGAGNVIVNPYIIKNDNGTWKYVGGTGTPNITQYNPSSPTGAVMALVYLDSNTGNPQIVVNSGTVFSNSITGSSQIPQYIPTITNPSQIPLAAIRLITGTSRISWDNIYDVRQFLHPISTGSGGGISSIPIQDEGASQGSATTLNFTGAGVQATISGSVANIDVSGGGSINTGTLDARYLKLDTSNDPLTGDLLMSGTHSISSLTFAQNVMITARSGTHSQDIVRIERSDLTGTSVSFPTYNGYIFSSYDTSPWAVMNGGWLFHQSRSGNQNFINPYARGTPVLKINSEEVWNSSGTLASFESHGTQKFKVDGLGNTNIPTGSTYNVGGTPHTHNSFFPFGVFEAISPMTASPSRPYGGAVDRNMTLISLACSVQVLTTNNGSNYWSIALRTLNAGAGFPTINTITTQSIAADTWELLTDNTFSDNTMTATDVGLWIECTKVGNPGGLRLFGPLLEINVP